MAITPSIARDILARHGLRAGRRHGQHFLVDPNTVRKIVRLAELDEDETVLEIGPGIGSLTLALADAARRVVAVELDPRVAGALREVVGCRDDVEVVVDDALRADLDLEGRLVSNLPYDVATPVFLRVLEEAPGIRGGLVMVQKEVGERWTAAPGGRSYGALTIKVAYHASAEVVASVPPTVFMPPPKVASVLVRFARRPSAPVEVDDPRAFFDFVTSSFAHRRKTLRNSLSAAGHEAGEVAAALRSGRLDERVRPEQLSIEQLAFLHRQLGGGQ